MAKRKPRVHKSVPSFIANDFMGPFLERHPYVAAKRAFVAGQIPIAQAAAMVAADREFIAEYELGELAGRYDDCGVYEAAKRVVVTKWRGELVAAIQASKRGA